jgi:hypothetical protein
MVKLKRLRALVALSAIALPGCRQNYFRDVGEITSTTNRVLATTGVGRIALDIRQGPILVNASPDDSARIELRVGPARGAMGTRRTCNVKQGDVSINPNVADATMTLSSAPALTDECVSEWRLSVPKSMSVDLKVTAGNVSVEGIEGNATVTTGSGDITVRMAQGSVRAETNVGDIDLQYTGDNFGSVDARTRVGDIDVFLNGRELVRDRAPGSGDELALKGDTRNAVHLRANVGEIKMRLGAPR